MGLMHTTQEFNELVVREDADRIIRLSDVGRAELGPQDTRSYMKMNGIPMVGVVVIPQPGANHIEIADAVYKRMETMKKDLRHVIVMTCDMYIYYSRAILGSFFDLLAGKVGVEELSGPLGTVSAVNQAVHYGWREVLSLLALLTINVGIFNLLPIPALDGCKLLFLAWEGLTGHPVPPRVQGVINTAGTVALVWLMILVTMHDISRFL